MKRLTLVSVMVVLGIVLAACAAPATPEPVAEPTAMPETMPSIVDVAVGNGSFTTLVGALQATGLVEALAGEGPFTVFAPSDEAFAKLPAGTLESLTPEQLKDILLYHVVAGKVMAADAVALDGQMVDTLLEGKQLAISVDGETVMINDAKVVTADVEAGNGVIHVIDSVLLPPTEEAAEEMTGSTVADIAAGDERFSTLVGALVSAGLVDALKGEGPFTVFAPTDDAFAALPAGTLEGLTPEQLKNILLYHVVPGKVMAADAVALDGQAAGTLLEGAEIGISVKDGKVFLNDYGGSRDHRHRGGQWRDPRHQRRPAAAGGVTTPARCAASPTERNQRAPEEPAGLCFALARPIPALLAWETAPAAGQSPMLGRRPIKVTGHPHERGSRESAAGRRAVSAWAPAMQGPDGDRPQTKTALARRTLRLGPCFRRGDGPSK